MPADITALLERAQRRSPVHAPVALYGAGGKGARTLTFLASQGVEVRAVLDANARPGQTCGGMVVQRPSEWLKSHDPADFDAVVAIHNPGVDLARLAPEVEALGFRRVVLPVELHQVFADALTPDFFLAPPARYRGRLDEIEQARRLLADETSRNWFDRALEFRLGGDYSVLPQPSPSDQYRPADLERWREPLRLVDCGAFDGDSVRMLKSGQYDVSALAAFEADPANFERLQREPGLPKESRLFPHAVGAAAGTVRFSSGQGGASHLDAAGDLTVPCVRLDDAIADFRPTLIKMDIEGAEHDALLGAAQLICENRPGLAVSAYHCAEDLWRLARLIDSWRLGYRLYLRGHAHSTFDLVLYGFAH
jgi:FkbM family methyltransferase